MDPVEKYIREFSSPEDPLLARLDRETHQRAVHPQMVSGHIQGKLLGMLVDMVRPEHILEIGTFTGYSALSMAAALSDNGIIDTIEADDELEDMISSYLAESPVGHKVRLHIGSALNVAPRLGLRFDMVFVDGDKREYPAYYRMLMGDGEFSATGPLVHEGSYIMADNILWYGKVAEPTIHTDPHTTAINAFNRMVAEDDRVENVILPLRDGINLIRVKYI